MARSMNIQPPFSGGMPRPLPQPVQAHNHQQGQEDLYRSTARTVGVLLTRHSRQANTYSYSSTSKETVSLILVSAQPVLRS